MAHPAKCHPKTREVSIPKRVSEVLWLMKLLPDLDIELVSIPKRVSEVLWLDTIAVWVRNG